jgi:Fe-S oxidoreductase
LALASALETLAARTVILQAGIPIVLRVAEVMIARRPGGASDELPMKLGAFIPCYIDAFFSEVGVATLELLERLYCAVIGMVHGLELAEIDRPDQCGFGGSFCVADEAVSAKMGYDRVHDFHRHAAQGARSLAVLFLACQHSGGGVG